MPQVAGSDPCLLLRGHAIACAASPLDVPLFIADLTGQRLKRGVFRSVIDLQVAINRFVAETNLNLKPFVGFCSVVQRRRRAVPVITSIR